MLFEALGAHDPAPRCYVCEGPDIAWLGDRPLAHYDMSGQCRGRHPHVVWDPASPNIDEIVPATWNLCLAVVGQEDLSYGGGGTYVNYEIWSRRGEVISAPKGWVPGEFDVSHAAQQVAGVALQTAGLSGQGTRAAMDWLASGRLTQMTAYCRQQADRSGLGSSVAVERLLDGPEVQLRAAVHKAWESLAPVEEAIRRGAQAQPLDLRSWLTGSAILVVSLPQQASMTHRQVAIAMLMAAEAASHHDRCQFARRSVAARPRRRSAGGLG